MKKKNQGLFDMQNLDNNEVLSESDIKGKDVDGELENGSNSDQVNQAMDSNINEINNENVVNDVEETKNTNDSNDTGEINNDVIVENEPKVEAKNYYIILSKGQIYSFLRKGYISSGIECEKSDPIFSEKFIKDNVLYVFSEDSLPTIDGKINSKGKYDIVLELDINPDNPYAIKDEGGRIIGIKGFLPITSLKQLLFFGNDEKNDFENPVPNKNDNFVIPSKLCSINEGIYNYCINEFKTQNLTIELENVLQKIEQYNRLLGAFFFSNFGAYVENCVDNYSEKFVKFLIDYYTEIPDKLFDDIKKSNNIMIKLAYSGEFSNIKTIDDLFNLLLNNNIINISDYNYLKSMYTSTSGFSDFGKLFAFKKELEDDITWQVISFLLQYCCNKSGEERCLALSNSISGKFSYNINVLTLFILGLCCGYTDMVCEIEGDEKLLLEKGKIKFKDIFSLIRYKIANDVYNFVVFGEKPNPFEYNVISTDVDLTHDNVIKLTKMEIEGENCIFTKIIPYSEYYQSKIKEVYGKKYEKINQTSYIKALLLRNANGSDDVEHLVNSFLQRIDLKDEELENIVELDKKHIF